MAAGPWPRGRDGRKGGKLRYECFHNVYILKITTFKGSRQGATTAEVRPPLFFCCTISVNNKALSAAIADLRNQKKLNFGAIAKKYIIDKTSLRYCFQTKQIVQIISNLQI